jgi:acyl-[acyl-carrier-protein]-phospholipid O-acyltransferase / long-chain-fatty-acid--[acyl-carrier-protein] ligase
MAVLKWLVKLLLKLCYRVEVHGLENFSAAGKRVLIVANHTSFLDAVLLAAFLPDDLTFAINTHVAKRWYVRPFLRLVRSFPMDPTSPYSTRSLIRYLQEDKKTVIFPEGRITVTGSLMKIYDGTGMIADKSGCAVLPIRIDGAQYTPFSRLRGRVRLRWFPKIRVTLLAPSQVAVPNSLRGRCRRQKAGAILADLMTQMMFATSNYRQTLLDALLDAKRIHGGEHRVVEDIERQPLSYNALLVRSLILGRLACRFTDKSAPVGVLLPNVNGTLVVFLGLHLYGRVPAMLNYTIGTQGMQSACRTANVKVVLTSRRFVQAAKLQAAVKALKSQTNVVYLEDLREHVGVGQKLGAIISMPFTRYIYRRRSQGATADSPAVILFTSGSEGTPKGVVLSHANVLANTKQIAARVAFCSQDIILNALPLFHSFGLTAGALLPLLAGMKTFLYPSPLHYRIVPEMAYDTNATVLFGTNTFLKGYARHAHPYDFYSVRYVFAGAEKLQDDVRRMWMDKFGIRILEGYGTTETAPVLAANTPMDYRAGSPGRFLPGIEHRLEPVPGVERGGRLHVRGPNVMLGYFLADRPGVLVRPDSSFGPGWYDTGDIVVVDGDGFVHIQGRAKRFAKIGGEMVSLTLVEDLATRTWPGALHAAVNMPDSLKGEQIVLLTDQREADRNRVLAQARADGIGEINVPKRIVYTKRIPLLGSGKIDYAGARSIIETGTAHG